METGKGKCLFEQKQRHSSAARESIELENSPF
jgi:hypothetical protein